ncbi:MAG TPA: alkaline phosphatase D family protein [Opitutaceae bacterium]|nr:alkaline phosphatase D family protein [Opitutaceae bacterium]
MLFRLTFLLVLATATASAQSFVGSVWAGNVSPTSATVSVRLNTPGVRVRVAFSLTPTLTAPIFSAAANTAAASNTVKVTVQGLKPDTDYYYGVEVANVIRTDEISRGRIRTFPLGRGSFKIAFGSCGDYRHPDQSAYDAIMRERPLLFINTGDLHYNDTNTTNADEYRVNYDSVLGQRNQGALYRTVPLAYMWDDHDYCGDNTDATAVGRNTARAVYKERVPHYPIGPSDGTIGQAFTIGRVRVIMTDLRSAAQPVSTRESATKTRMGVAQKAWFKQELIAARDSAAPMILWVCPDPWIGRAGLTEDTWGGHATERTEIANFIRDNRISNVVVVAGDMHALAFDDGDNSDYATGGGAPLTVLHGAALTQGGSIKGGPYGGGPIPGSQQFGMLEVYDSGGPGVACRFLGMRAGEGAKLTHIFSSSPVGTSDHALVNISTLARINSSADSLVSGFVISGTTARNVLVRAIGPTLGAFGVSDALARPDLAVFQGDRVLATNSRWNSSPESLTRLTAAFDQVGAFRLVDQESYDSAVVLSVAPGAYTVQVKSADGAPGAVLLEVYDLP